jgi:DUF917 family protein
MTEKSTSITAEWVEHVATGGAVLGGGGGGSPTEGIEFGLFAVEYGHPEVIQLDALETSETVLTVSAVGAPAATESHVDPSDYVRATERLVDRLADRGEPVGALMTNEMGGFASVNGLVQSAVTGLPLVDAACNGRAHPTGPMGSIGLDGETTTLQAAVGGRPDTEYEHELVVEARLRRAAATVRRTATAAGGLVAVARNPVSAGYASDNAAVGVYDQAESIGRDVVDAEDGRVAAGRVADRLDGEVVTVGTVESKRLETNDGFDVGEVTVDGHRMTLWNEYMTLDHDGTRLATFPDLIATLNADTGQPVSTAAVSEGDTVAVLTASASALTLGAGMTDPELFEPVERAVGKDVTGYGSTED